MFMSVYCFFKCKRKQAGTKFTANRIEVVPENVNDLRTTVTVMANIIQDKLATMKRAYGINYSSQFLPFQFEKAI